LIWKVAKDHVEHGNKIHPNARNNKTEIIDETSFINSWEHEKNILNKLKNLPGVTKASKVNGVYDIVVKLTSDSLGKLKETIA
jgi:DNA-binding Lrp family transcriptional regulator